MTSKQISAVLKDLGYSLNTKVALSEVSSIYTAFDGNLFPDRKTVFEFSTKNGELLLIYSGHYENDVFILDYEKPKYIIPFEMILGFTMVSPTHIKEPFRFGLGV